MFPETGLTALTNREYQDQKLSSMADAMDLAAQRVREVGDPDPDPYGYGQEVEHESGLNLLQPEWKSRPDDTRWNKRILSRARKAEVAKLFLQGYRVPEISQKLQVSEVTIHKDLENCHRDWKNSYMADVETLAAKDLARLDQYLVNLAPGIERGDTKSIGTAVDIIRQRGTILGYTQGLTVDIETHVREVAEANGFDPEKAVQMAQRISVTMRG